MRFTDFISSATLNQPKLLNALSPSENVLISTIDFISVCKGVVLKPKRCHALTFQSRHALWGILNWRHGGSIL